MSINAPATAAAASALAHTVTLTLDVPAHLLASRTPGHHHLYLNAPMRWTTYKALLKALAKAQVVDPKWARQCIKGGQSLLRPPARAYNEWADPALVYALNPAHVDIHNRHVMVRRQEREERDAYTVERYTVLAPVTDRTIADYVTSHLLTPDGRRSPLHAPALDIDTPAVLTPDPTDPQRTRLTITLPAGAALTTRQRARRTKTLTKALTKAGITRP